MKSFLERFSEEPSRYDFFLLVVPFVLWIVCFWDFFCGRLHLQADAISYGEQIRFYTDNLSHGVFPLWDPKFFSGVPFEFFLRRIGDVNPLLLLMVALKWLGVGTEIGYLIFLGAYYFLAGWAMYLTARWLFKSSWMAFAAYVLFLFSSWGSEIFYNYIIIIFVPVIWFFYFLLCFSSSGRKAPFVGMCFCLGLIATTYIPFFFLVILAVFTGFYAVFYSRPFLLFFKTANQFVRRNTILAFVGLVFLGVSCIPGLLFYRESKSGEFVLPSRHAGAQSPSAVAVGLQNAAGGDIVSHGYFDRLFDDHQHLDMGDIYLPYVFFLFLLCTLPARSNKLIYFLLLNILALSLITVTSAAGVHRFLYEHVAIFKFIRQVYYFFWLAILPMAILLAVAAFQSLLQAIDVSARKPVWFSYIFLCHAVFLLFLAGHRPVAAGAWAAVAISLLYFWVYCFVPRPTAYAAGFCLLLAAVFAQSAQVYGFLAKKVFRAQDEAVQFDLRHPNTGLTKFELYYASKTFAILNDQINVRILEGYRRHRFVVYDNVLPYDDTPQFFKSLRQVFADDINAAFVSRLETTPADWANGAIGGHADTAPEAANNQLSVSYADPNTYLLWTHFSRSRFLVLTNNYSSRWHAFVNGRPARLLRANFSFQGLWVPPGECRVLLRFSDWRMYAFHGGLLLLFAVVFVYMLALLRKDPPWTYA